MQITDVQIHRIQHINGLVGFADLVIGSSLSLKGIGIYERGDGQGYRLTYPTKQAGMHNINLFHPTTSSLSQMIEKAIFQKL